jgi:hypothetical protein
VVLGRVDGEPGRLVYDEHGSGLEKDSVAQRVAQARVQREVHAAASFGGALSHSGRGTERGAMQRGVRAGLRCFGDALEWGVCSIPLCAIVARKRWQYLVGRFLRRKNDLWFESSAHPRSPIKGGVSGFADVLNKLGAEGWELVHTDDTPPRVIAGEGEDAMYAWGDMIFKRPMD